MALTFWREIAECPTPHFRPLRRTKMFQWLFATEHLSSPNPRRPKVSSRRLTSSAPWYAQSTKDRTDLLGKGSNVDTIADTCHRIWADVQSSLRDARSFHTVLATALNLDKGPGETGTWMGRARTASNKSCPLFQSQVDKIRKDYSCCCVSPEDDDGAAL